MKRFISKMASLLDEMWGPCTECGRHKGDTPNCQKCAQARQELRDSEHYAAP